MKTLTLFNLKGGVGKTTLIYHLAWMYADLGLPVLVVDLDPQANLSGMFLDEARLEELWPAGDHPQTIYGALQPLLEGTGDLRPPHVEPISERLGLLVGDLMLIASNEVMHSQWQACLAGKPKAFHITSAFWRVIEQAAQAREAALVIIDLAPNLGAVNRAALISTQYVGIPLVPDIVSAPALNALGSTLRTWRKEWGERRTHNPLPDLSIPPGTMQPIGYVVLQHAVRLDHSVQAYNSWMASIPLVYRQSVLDEAVTSAPDISHDEHNLASLKQYRSLMPLAQEARKPMFFLRAADGAIGGHAAAVQECYSDFRALALRIARRCEITLP